MYFINWWIKPDGLCLKCRQLMLPKWVVYKKLEMSITSLYRYDGLGRDLLLSFKDSKDIWLKDVFLNPVYLRFLVMYYGYTIVLCPSTEVSRGYRPNLKLVEDLGMNIVPDVFEKLMPYKQSEMSLDMRKDVGLYIGLKNVDAIRGKKVLLFDDVCTSGHTLRACYELIVGEVSQIKVFALFQA